MVDLEGHFPAVGADGSCGEHPAGVVGQDVDVVVVGQQLRSEPAHVAQPAEVDQVGPAADPPRDRLGLLR